MIEYANKTQFGFEPGAIEPVASTSAAVVYTTPAELRETLEDLARLKYIRATFKGKVQFSAGESAAKVVVRLRDSATVYAEATVQAAGGEKVYPFRVDNVDLSQVAGGARLYVEAEVLTTGTETFSAPAQLDVIHPLVVSGC